MYTRLLDQSSVEDMPAATDMMLNMPAQCHSHNQTFEVCYVVNGILAFTLDQHTFTAVENDCVVIRPGVHHCIFNPTATPAKLLLWSTSGIEARDTIDTTQTAVLTQAMMEHYNNFYDQTEHDRE
jgi:mannose-6-phosphate isomerase-like protein (cupin superfamily)